VNDVDEVWRNNDSSRNSSVKYQHPSIYDFREGCHSFWKGRPIVKMQISTITDRQFRWQLEYRVHHGFTRDLLDESMYTYNLEKAVLPHPNAKKYIGTEFAIA
jgi:hypothetical protein